MTSEAISDELGELIRRVPENGAAQQSLDLSDNEIGAAGVQALAEALLGNSTLQSLNLSSNEIGDAGVQALAEALPRNSTLQSLDLGDNDIGVAGVQALAEALPRNSTLQSLNLSSNDIGVAGVQALAEALPRNSTLQSLNLSSNDIGAAGAQALAEALLGDSTLQSLNLSSNEIGDAGAQALAEALLGNSTLQSLDLGDNDIGAAGAQALAEALLGNSTLQSLDLQSSMAGPAGAQALAKALLGNSSLQSLNLLFNEIGDVGAQALAEALPRNSTLQSLNLVRNSIGAVGAQALAEALPRNCALRSLDLLFNEIGNGGAQALAEALPRNTTLQSLDLGYDSIGAAGAQALAQALPCNSTLQSLDLSGNDMGDAEAQALSDALTSSDSHSNLTHLALSELLQSVEHAVEPALALVNRRARLIKAAIAAATADNVAQLQQAVDALHAFGASIDLVGQDHWIGLTGTTALMAAAEHGHEACVRLLLAEGANPSLVHFRTGHTAASIARRRGHMACVVLLHGRSAPVPDAEPSPHALHSLAVAGEVRQLGHLVSGSEDPVRERLELDDDADGGHFQGRDSYIASSKFGAVFRMRPVADQAAAPAPAAAGAGGPQDPTANAGTARRMAVKVILNFGSLSSESLIRRAKTASGLFTAAGAPLREELHPNVGPVVWAGLSQLPPHFLWRVCTSNQLVRGSCAGIGAVPLGERTLQRLHQELDGGGLGKAFHTLSRRQARQLQASADPSPSDAQAALAEQQTAGGGDALQGLPLPKRSYCLVMPLYDTTLEAVSDQLCADDSWPAWAVVRSWAQQLVDGTAWLYDHGVLHLDLKLDNVMVCGNTDELAVGSGRLVLVNFGMHRVVPDTVANPSGRRQDMHVLPEAEWGATDRQSRWVAVIPRSDASQLWGNGAHVAPELHCAARLCGQLQHSTDDMAFDFTKQPVFALGVLLYEACTGGDHPIEGYDGTTAEEEEEGVVADLPADAPYPDAFKALLQSMAALKPQDRPTMGEVVRRMAEL